jgi:hypothetical protein
VENAGLGPRDGQSSQGSGGPGLAEVLVVWALCGLIGLSILLTYSREPHEKLYHVSGSGLSGGLSRLLVFVNWPGALIAIAVLGVVLDRVRQPLLGLIALVLCAVVAVPGVLDQANLDAKWINLVPAIGVGIVLLLTALACRNGIGGWGDGRGDWLRVAVFVVLAVVALPWFFAEQGVYVGDIPGLGSIFMSKKVIDGEAAVHLGEHHGMVGLQVIVAALLLSRELPRMRAGARRTALALWLSGLLAYGAGNIANDAWGEQVVKRGWTDWKLPSVVRPDANWLWLVVLAVTAVVFFTALRPRGNQAETHRANSET